MIGAYILVSLGVMLTAVLMVHIGLTDAMSKVIAKVLGCHQCLTFWAVLMVLVIIGAPLALTPMIAIVFAYLSNWVVVLLMLLQNIYHKLWLYVKRIRRYR